MASFEFLMQPFRSLRDGFDLLIRKATASVKVGTHYGKAYSSECHRLCPSSSLFPPVYIRGHRKGRFSLVDGGGMLNIRLFSVV